MSATYLVIYAILFYSQTRSQFDTLNAVDPMPPINKQNGSMDRWELRHSYFFFPFSFHGQCDAWCDVLVGPVLSFLVTTTPPHPLHCYQHLIIRHLEYLSPKILECPSSISFSLLTCKRKTNAYQNVRRVLIDRLRPRPRPRPRTRSQSPGSRRLCVPRGRGLSRTTLLCVYCSRILGRRMWSAVAIDHQCPVRHFHYF